jgi:hypothetical protein
MKLLKATKRQQGASMDWGGALEGIRVIGVDEWAVESWHGGFEGVKNKQSKAVFIATH